MLPRVTSPISVLLVVLLQFTISSFAQSLSVDQIVLAASEQRDRYIDAFQNLMAVEEKSFEIYGRDGTIKNRRAVTSNFIIYRLARSVDTVVEFRNVIAVDGKRVSSDDTKIEEFFAKLEKSESSRSELGLIEKESFRYDPDIKISGLTLFQAVACADNIRPAIHFSLVGHEKIGERDSFVVAFEQFENSPYIRVNRGEAPDPKLTSLIFDIEGPRNKPMNERIRGKLWIDSITFRVAREVREVTVQPAEFQVPVVISKTDSTYQESEFEILTPMRIVQELFELKPKDKRSIRDISAVFQYSRFTKADVEIRSAEIKK